MHVQMCIFNDANTMHAQPAQNRIRVGKGRVAPLCINNLPIAPYQVSDIELEAALHAHQQSWADVIVPDIGDVVQARRICCLYQSST